MLRIGVIGAAADDLRMAALRLHGVLIEACGKFDADDPIQQSADAIAFLAATSPDPEHVAGALTARQHVLVATPAGLPPDQLARLATIAREHAVTFAVENPDHALPSRRLIRQQIDSAQLGDVGLVRICRCEPPVAGGGRGSAHLPASLIGDLELAAWLVGRAPDTVFAVRRRSADPQVEVGDFLQVHLGFPHGSMALVTFTNVWPSGDAHQSLSVIAATGAAYADDHQNRQLLYSRGPVTAPIADEGTATAALLHDFVADVQNRSDRSDRHRAWRQLATIVAAVEESIASHDAIPLELN